LILGAGSDVEPLLQICDSLGWNVTVSDHRPAYVSRLQRHDSTTAGCMPADEIAAKQDFSQYDAAIVMSHNLTSDRAYLRALAATDVSFVGLLGPPQRRDRLLEEIGDDAGLLADRLRSPAGKLIGGRGRSSIALEVVVERQELFCGSDYRSLSASRSACVSMSIDAGSKLTGTTDNCRFKFLPLA